MHTERTGIMRRVVEDTIVEIIGAQKVLSLSCGDSQILTRTFCAWSRD